MDHLTSQNWSKWINQPVSARFICHLGLLFLQNIMKMELNDFLLNAKKRVFDTIFRRKITQTGVF